MDWDKVRAQRSVGGNESKVQKTTTSNNDSDLWSRVRKQRKAEATYNATLEGRLGKSLKKFESVYSNLYSSANSPKWRSGASYDLKNNQISNVLKEIDEYIYEINATDKGTEYLDALNGVKKQYSSLQDYLTGEKDYYSQWSDAESYARAMEKAKAQEAYAKEQDEKVKKYSSMTDDELDAEVKRLEDSKKGNAFTNLAMKVIGAQQDIKSGTNMYATGEANQEHNETLDYDIALIEKEKTNRKYKQIDELPGSVKALVDELTVIDSTNDDEEFIAKMSQMQGFAWGVNGNNNHNVLSGSERRGEIVRELESMGVENWQELLAYNKLRYNEKKNAPTKAEYVQMAKEHPVLSSLVSIPASLGKGIGIFEMVENRGSDVPLDPNSPYFGMNNFVNTTRETVMDEHDFHLNTGNETIDNIDIFDELYSTGMSMGDSIMAGLGGMGIKGLGGSVLGLSAASDAAQEVAERGGSSTEAITTGLVSGMNEMLWESLSLGKLDDLISNGVKKRGFVPFVKELLKSMGINASEEFNTEASNLLADYLINGGASTYAETVQNYLSAGYTQDEAKKLANKDMLTQVGKAGVGGALQGLFMGVGGGALSTTANAIDSKSYENKFYNKMGSNVVENNNVSQLVEEAKSLGNSKLAKLANLAEGVNTEELSTKDAKKYVHQVGKLYEGVQKAQFDSLSKTSETAFRNVIKSELKKSGVADRDAVADILVKAMHNKGLTRAESQKFQSVNGRSILDKALGSAEFNKALDAEQKKQFTEGFDKFVNTESLAGDKYAERKAVLISKAGYKSGAEKTFVDATDEVVDSLKVNSIKGDTITLDVKLGENNQVVAADELTFDNDYAVIISGLQSISKDFGLDVDSANRVLALWESFDGDSFDFYKTAQSGIMYGQYNQKKYFDNATFGNVPDNIRNELYNIGKEYRQKVTDTKAKAIKERSIPNGEVKVTFAEGVQYHKLTKSQKAQVDMAQIIARAFGFNLEVFRSPKVNGKSVGENGSFSPSANIMRLDIDAGTLDGKALILFTQGHELTHFIKAWSETAYKKFADFLIEKYTDKDVPLNDLVEKKIRESELIAQRDNTRKVLSYDGALEEVVCDACEDFLADPNIQQTILEIAKVDQSLADKIKNFIKNLINRLEKALRGLQGQSDAAAYTRQLDANDLQELKDLWTSALIDARENVLQAKARGGEIQKNTTAEGNVKKQARELQKKDPTKLKEADLLQLLDYAKNKKLIDGSYIPVRINTPQILIDFAREMGHTLENHPIAMRVYKARQAMANDTNWDGNINDTPHNLAPEEVVKIIRALNTPSHLVYQRKNDRFSEIVKFEKDSSKEKAVAIIDFFDVDKNPEIMNGYEGGKYNILVTVYPSESNVDLKAYLKNKQNLVMTGEEMKKKGSSQRGLGSYVPAHLNDSPFFEDIITNPSEDVNTADEKRQDRDANTDLYSRISEMQLEVNKIRQSIMAIESSDDFKEEQRKLSEAFSKDIDTAIEFYKKWLDESEYGKLKSKKAALEEELDKLRTERDNKISAKALDEEEKAIAKSGLSEADYFRKQAVKEFGYTPYFYDAGYITPNGKMLNFSGEKGKHYGSRGQDHRGIGVIYANTEGTEALNRFMKDGNIRIMAESPGIDITTVAEPTKEQYSTVKKFISKYANREFFNVDLTDASGKVIGSLRYEGRINPTRVINDIKHYYATGEIREQSSVERFLFQDRVTPEQDAEYMDAVNRKDVDTLEKMVVKAAEKAMPNSKVRDDNGKLRMVYHGRVSEFNVFDRSFSNIEGDFGKGYYFTSNEYDVDSNYASEEGPDLVNKIARYAEKLEYEDEFADLTYEEREEIAREKLITSEPNTITAYLNMENPVYITPNEQGTFLDFNAEYDEEYDEYGEPDGLLVDFIEALNNNAEDYSSWSNVDFSFLYEYGYEGGLYAADAVKIIKDKIIDELSDENGDYAVNEVIRLAFEDIGFDGIIDTSVYYKFRNMNGMDSDTTHYIVFNSNQIKEADLVTYDDNGNIIPLSERFNEGNNDIRYQDRDSTGRALTPEQVEFFKNSKVRDEKGRLLIVHRGSPEDYGTIFKFLSENLNSKDKPNSFGFFFTDNYDTAEYYSKARGQDGDIKSVYLNIKNPLDLTSLGISCSEKEFYRLLEENGVITERSRYKQDYKPVWTRFDKNGEDLRRKIESAGFDGVVYHDWGEVKATYVAFYSNQIKDIDNLTPTESDDIYYQDRPYQPSLEDFGIDYKAENDKLKADVDRLNKLLKLQRTLTHGALFTKTSVDKAASLIMKEFGLHRGKSDLSEKLNALYTFVASSNDLTWDEFYDRASQVANWMIDSKPDQRYYKNPYASEVLKNIRERGITLNEKQKEEAAYYAGSLNAYRKSNIGNFRIVNEGGISLTELWEQLVEDYPGAFSQEDIEKGKIDTNLPSLIVEVISTMRQTESVLEQMDRTQEVRKIVEKIYDTYWNVTTLHTLADKHQKEINLLKSKHRAEMDALKKKGDENLKQVKDRYRETLQKVREDKDAKMTAYKEHVAEQRHKSVEGRNKTATKNKIKRVVQALASLYNNPTKEKNVKNEFQDMVDKALVMADAIFDNGNISVYDILSGDIPNLRESERKALEKWRENQKSKAEYQRQLDELEASEKLDQATHDRLLKDISECNRKLNYYSGKLKEVIEIQRGNLNDHAIQYAIDSLVSAYKSLNESTEGYAKAAYNEYVDKRLVALKEALKNTTIKTMTQTQLNELYQAYKMVLTTVRTANELFIKNKKMTVADAGEAVMREVQSVAKVTENKVAMKQNLNKFMWEELKPVYAFERIGSETFMNLYKEILRGQSVFGRDIAETQYFFQRKSKAYNYDSWDLDERRDFKLADGRTFTISLQEIMSIYAYSKREQALDHIAKGGFVFDSNEFFTDTKEKGIKGKIKKVRTTVEAYRLNDETFYKVINSLTPEQKKFVDDMQDYLSTVMGAKGNEVSRVLYGIDLFREKYYFPLMSSHDFIQQTNNPAGEVALKNSGMAKATVPHARNPIILKGFMDVWAEHTNKMSTYHAFVLPIENLNKVFNYTGYATDNKSVSVQTILNGAYGPAVNQYITALLQDLNGGIKVQGSGNWVTKGISLFKKTAVAASTSVVVQQPTAVIRAMAMIDGKYFIHGKDGLKHNEAWDKIKKYAPIAVIKEMGGFDVGGGKQVGEYITAKSYKGKDKIKGFFTDSKYRDDALMWGASKMDEVGWVIIWNAVEQEIADTTTYKVGSEEFLQACGERFTEVIDYTQVYDSVLSRSGFMRNKGEISKMATSFMGEPTTSFNMLCNAVLQLKRGNISKLGATKIVGATMASIIFAAIAKSLIYALRDDDEDESYVEKYAQALTDSLKSDLFIPNMLPYVSDITSLLSGWDVERTDMAILKDLKDAVDGLDSSSKSPYRKVEDLAGAVAAFGGIPLKNVMRTTREMYNAVANIFDGNTADFDDVGDAVVESFVGETSVADVNKALDKGNTAKAKETINELVADKVESGKTEKEAKASIKASVTSYWKDLYLQAYRDKDNAEMLRIRRILQATGLYDDVLTTCSNWIKGMKDETTDTGFTKW